MRSAHFILIPIRGGDALRPGVVVGVEEIVCSVTVREIELQSKIGVDGKEENGQDKPGACSRKWDWNEAALNLGRRIPPDAMMFSQTEKIKYPNAALENTMRKSGQWTNVQTGLGKRS